MGADDKDKSKEEEVKDDKKEEKRGRSRSPARSPSPKRAAPKKKAAPKAKAKKDDDESDGEPKKHPQRVRTKATQMQMEVGPEKAAGVVIPKGSGDALGDIHNVNVLLSKEKDSTMVGLIHRLCFKSPGKKTTAKKEIRQFCGLAQADKDGITARLERIALPKLRVVARIFDCKPDNGDKDDYVEAIAKFLGKPKASGRTLREASPSPRKRKASGKKSKKGKRSKKDPDAPKKGLSAYMFFCADQRDAVKKKHPSYTLGEIAKKLGAKWGDLTDAEKKPYNKQAAKDKERYAKEMAAYKKKAKKSPKKDKKRKRAEESEDDSSSEESGDESEEETTPAKKKGKKDDDDEE